MTGPFAFCGIAVAHSGGSHFAIGTAPGISADADTMFRVASISKIVVGQAVAAAVNAGRADWQTEVADILGWSFGRSDGDDAPLTLGMLASHSAGLTDAAGYLVPPDADLAGWCQAREIQDAPPGTRFAYSNLGYLLLAAVLEQLTGQSFPDAAKPLWDGPGGFNWVGVPAAERNNRLPSFRKDGDRFLPQIDDEIVAVPEGRHPGIYSPQGGLRLSLRGMLALADRLRHADTIRLWTPAMGPGEYLDGVFESYGAGLQIFDAPVFYPRPLIGHFGNAYGFKGGVWYDPTADTAFAYALNGLPVGDEDDTFSQAELDIFATAANIAGPSQAA